jgi:hypothetical protein
MNGTASILNPRSSILAFPPAAASANTKTVVALESRNARKLPFLVEEFPG